MCAHHVYTPRVSIQCIVLQSILCGGLAMRQEGAKAVGHKTVIVIARRKVAKEPNGCCCADRAYRRGQYMGQSDDPHIYT